MSKKRHLLRIVGFLMMTATAAPGQVNTAKPGEPVGPFDSMEIKWPTKRESGILRGERDKMRFCPLFLILLEDQTTSSDGLGPSVRRKGVREQ